MRLAPSVHSLPSVRRSGAAWRALVLGLGLAIGLGGAPASADGGPAAADPDATAEDAPPLDAKSYWQDRYKSLLERRDELNEIIETERELYADANRRNYRRGNKRHRHRAKMLEAEAELVEVEAALEVLPDEARAAGALPGWFYEVEEDRK